MTVLTNGNYVVTDPGWRDEDNEIRLGAAHLYDGITNTVISTLTGTRDGEVAALSNGNFVVVSQRSSGTVTWVNGVTGLDGSVTAANSLVGAAAGFDGGVVALSNGNYVVVSPFWDNGAVADVGAATWGDGATGVAGPVTAANSLVGTGASHLVGFDGVVALSNGNYVVVSSFWESSVFWAGAVTWGNGATGIVGPVTSANSLVGSTGNDRIGRGGVVALTNGNYVVASPGWHTGTRTRGGTVRLVLPDLSPGSTASSGPSPVMRLATVGWWR